MNKKVLYSLIGLAVVFFITSLFIFIKSGDKSKPDGTTPQKKKSELVIEESTNIKVKAFFFVEGRSFMLPVPQEIELTGIKEDRYRQFMQILMEGEETFITPIPEGVTLRSIYLIEHQELLVVDFSEELIHNFPAGTSAEMEFIYFVVNNICYNFKEIKKVKFMVAGNEYHTISGHIDIENPFYPDFRYLKD
jgi:spore germination protein GerM